MNSRSLNSRFFLGSCNKIFLDSETFLSIPKFFLDFNFFSRFHFFFFFFFFFASEIFFWIPNFFSRFWRFFLDFETFFSTIQTNTDRKILIMTNIWQYCHICYDIYWENFPECPRSKRFLKHFSLITLSFPDFSK